jgi:hypothetical protein
VWQRKLERHCAAELNVFGGVHDAHAAGGEIIFHTEVRDISPDDAEGIARLRFSLSARCREIKGRVYFGARVCHEQALECFSKGWIFCTYLVEA